MRSDWIVIHTAAADRSGVTIAEIDRWHRERGFARVGYHYVIEDDGAVRIGRDESVPGAHARGLNSRSLGICVTGHGDVRDFAECQYAALTPLVVLLVRKYGLSTENIIGHREIKIKAGAPEPGKSCPGKMVNMVALRARVRAAMGATE